MEFNTSASFSEPEVHFSGTEEHAESQVLDNPNTEM